MKIYFDVCCLKRSFDEQTQIQKGLVKWVSLSKGFIRME